MKKILTTVTLIFIVSGCLTTAEEARQFEENSDRDRVLHLKLMTTQQLCNAHNNDLSNAKILGDIKAILKTRGVQVCVTETGWFPKY